MKKWIFAACATAGFAALVGYKLFKRTKKHRSKSHHFEQSNVDIEEILDDDILEDYDGAVDSATGIVDSDDELNSDVETCDIEASPYGRRRGQKAISAKEGAMLKGLAKKIRANREKLAGNDESSKTMLRNWAADSKKDEPIHSTKTGKMNQDTVFYNLFACYAESATQNK